MKHMSKKIWMALVMVGALASPTLAQDACKYVTKEEVSAIAGFQVDVATPQTLPGATACVYGAKTQSSVQVRTYTGEAAAHAEVMCKGGQAVSGLGDKACTVSHGPASTLTVMKGGTALAVIWFKPLKPNPEEVLKQIAEKALARM